MLYMLSDRFNEGTQTRHAKKKLQICVTVQLLLQLFYSFPFQLQGISITL